MVFVDANELPSATTVDAEICVIGSGAAGLTVASLLDRTSIRVCLVESGSHGPDEETQSLYDLESVGHPVRENFMSRARYFGGTSNLWAGRCMWLSPFDFGRRDWIPHSGWPIAYDEVSRHYPAAAQILGLPSSTSADRVLERSRAHPVEGRFVEDENLRPNLSVWGRKPLRFGAAFRQQLEGSRHASVFLNTSITSIVLNQAGTRVETCVGTTLGGKAIRFVARRFVVACGGLETARLLLASRSVAPNGIGNEHDAVGRYYMDHPRAVYGRVRLFEPAKLPAMLGLALPDGMAQVGIQLSEATQQRESLLNNYLTVERQWSDQTARAYQSFVHSAKILLRAGYAGRRFSVSRAQLARIPELIYLLAPREILPHACYRAARRLKDRLGKGVADLVIVNYCEQAPNPRSRVYLGRECDRFGVPRLVLDWIVGRAETRTLLRLHELLDYQLRRAGLGRVDHSSEVGEPRYTDASHHLGTTRMSADPHDGVVDGNCRVHGVANLFISGSGVFPTAGHANPTLTIVALAIRLARHLARTTP